VKLNDPSPEYNTRHPARAGLQGCVRRRGRGYQSTYDSTRRNELNFDHHSDILFAQEQFNQKREIAAWTEVVMSLFDMECASGFWMPTGSCHSESKSRIHVM